MPIFAAAGSRFFIGDAAIDDKDTDFELADFATVTWVEVSPIETIGTVGQEASEITFDSLNRKRTTVMKGTRRAPNLEVTAGLDYNNTGQAKLLEAEGSDRNYPIRVVFNDAPATGLAPTPSERMMIGLVMSVGEQVDDANSVMRLSCTIGVNSNVVRVNAATGG